MDVRMPDGTLVQNVPDNITQSDLLARYSAFKMPDTRGNIITSDVRSEERRRERVSFGV